MTVSEQFDRPPEAEYTGTRRWAPEAFAQLIRDYQGPLIRYAATQGAVDPEGLVNEIFLRLHMRSSKLDFPSESALRGYLYRATRNLTIDEARRRASRPTEVGIKAESQAFLVDGFEARIDSADQVEQLLSHLTPEQREVIELRYISDLSLKQTAQQVGKSVGTVKALQHRGIDKLRAFALTITVVVLVAAMALAYRQLLSPNLQPISSDPNPVDRPEQTVDPVLVEDSVPDMVDQRSITRSDGDPDAAGEALMASGNNSEADEPGPEPTVPAADRVGTGSTDELGVPPDRDVASPQPPSASAPTTTSTPATTAPGPSLTIGPPSTSLTTTVPTSSCPSFFVGGYSVNEGESGIYTLEVPVPTNTELSFVVTIKDGTAGRTTSYPAAASQDIMWGGSYSVGQTDETDLWTETSRVYNRVPISSNPGDGDRAAIGPPDASWDYSILVGGQLQPDSFTVTIPAGALSSQPIEVWAWREAITVDLNSKPNAGYDEGQESFSLEADGGTCAALVQIDDIPNTRFIGGG